MKATLTATLIASFAAPAFAGGPVIIEDTTEVVAEKPASSVGALPLVILLAVTLIAVTGGGDEEDCGRSRSCG